MRSNKVFDEYCITQCERGKAKAAELLERCDSVWDAADEMRAFTRQCQETPQCEFVQRSREVKLN